MKIEEYDYNLEQRRLRSFHREAERCMLESVAIQTALSEHPVSRFVRGLPVESAQYPAIEYLRLADQLGRDVGEVRDFYRIHHGYTDPHDIIQEESHQETEFCGDNQETYHHVSDSVLQDIIDPHVPKEFIHWCMPAHDRGRPKRKGCGFIRGPDNTVVHTACPEEYEHYIKGKRRHCWSLRCPECMNDTALRNAVEMEKELLKPKILRSKEGIDIGEIGHWVVSPPQEFAKSMLQTKQDYDELSTYIQDSMQCNGALGGVTIVHPWRQNEDRWVFSPHFHILCYGRIDTKRFLQDNPGWIIKKVHPRERIRSIRHTAAYLMTHMGLPLYEKDPEDIDWDSIILDRLIPDTISEKDSEDMNLGKGRLVGDLSDMDWEQWTMDRLTGEMRIRYWGIAARGRTRTIATVRQYRIRVCKECGTPLRTYDGFSDKVGSYVRYIQDSAVVVLAERYSEVTRFLERYRARMHQIGYTMLDFSRDCRYAVCTLDFPGQDNGDILMDGPFDEPDPDFRAPIRNMDAVVYAI